MRQKISITLDEEQANTPEFQEEIAVGDVTVNDESVLPKEQKQPKSIQLTDLDPWTQSLIGVIQHKVEEPTESYVDYLEEKYR